MTRRTKPTPSLVDEVKTHLATLRLKEIARILDDELSRAAKEGTPPAELVRRLFAAEALAARERRIARRIDEAMLPDRKLIADYDFVFQTGVDKAQVLELATLGFIERKQSLILAGNSGTGKSHIAKAILLTACQRQMRCRYTTSADMLRYLLAGLCDDSLVDRLKEYVAPDVVVIDELGLDRIEMDAGARKAALFHKVVEARYGKKSTILTTNVDFAELGTYLGDALTTTSTVDRLIHHAIIIDIQGPSWRMHESELINRAKPSGGRKT